MNIVAWEYEVRAGAEAAFEALYGADGAWVALFRTHPGYIGTELLRDALEVAAGRHRYLTIDRWRSAADYDAFLASDRTRYAEIDARGDALTASERRVGRYETL
ncbi:MAG: antibiotic biosynthesis monooxygenase [Luteimonas sp.]|nr:antibiotic biosynthesis monooxygenase [Luteimonas sp.]